MPLKPLLWIVFVVGLLPSIAGAQELGVPPRDPSADRVPRPVSAQALTIPPIDRNNRSAVVQLFNDVYVPTSSVAAIWTGSISSCISGATSAAYKDATITRVNYYRTMAGIPGTLVLDDSLDSAHQDAALMTSANGMVNHNPPTTWQCYSSGGASAAGQSNLASGTAGAEAIALYVDDPGFANEAVGHRRWVLFPPQQTMATGSVIGSGVSAANVLKVIGGWTTRPASPEFVSWPPPGFLPYQLLPSASKRWSFSISGADFSAATVSMTKAGTALATSLAPIATGYGDNTLVWLVPGISYGAPARDEAYDVTVSNVIMGTSTRTFTYTVTVIDPAVGIPRAPTNLRSVP